MLRRERSAPCAGNNSPQIAPPTGAPAITVPMGFVVGTGRSALPAGLQFLGRPWDEGRLLKIAFAYEQATQHRRCGVHLGGCPVFVQEVVTTPKVLPC